MDERRQPMPMALQSEEIIERFGQAGLLPPGHCGDVTIEANYNKEPNRYVWITFHVLADQRHMKALAADWSPPGSPKPDTPPANPSNRS